MRGYQGKVLMINLSTEEWEAQKIEDSVYEKYLSGVGLGAWYLLKNIPAKADPLGPENILGFTSGLLTGTGSVMTGRWMAVCKSPLTGGWGDSNCGGDLAPAIKQCGYDAIFFKGTAKNPVYVYIDNKGPQIRDAGEYWGLDAIETEDKLIEANKVKKKPAVATIGPAAEKRSLISGISNDRGRYAARSGVGAVMGSKNLKALVLAGTKQIKATDPEGIRVLSKEYAAKIRKLNAPRLMTGGVLTLLGWVMGKAKTAAPADGMLIAMLLKKWGSSVNNTLSIHNGDAPLKNWGGSEKDYKRSYYKHINADLMKKREKRKYHCIECIVGCGGICGIKDLQKGRFNNTHKPEYETVMSFGGLLMNKDTDAIFLANEICNRAGLDTISAGGVIAFAIECYENGILTKEDTGNLDLKWGNSEAILALLEKIAKREEGLGDLLADGVKKAAEKIGKGSEQFAVHAGGQELPMHDPKIDPMLGVTYSADPTPGRHTTSSSVNYGTSALWEKLSWLPPLKKHPKADEYTNHDDEALKNVAYTSYKMLVDGAGGCYYAMLMGVQHFKIFEYLNCATGWNKYPYEYIEIGKRIQNARQAFNAKHEVDVTEFMIHDRASGVAPLTSGHNQNLKLNIPDSVKAYRKAWGWNPETGYPEKQTLEMYQIDELMSSGAFND